MKLIKESEDNNHQHDRLKRRLLFLLVLLLVVDLTGNGLALAGHRGELSGSNLAAGPQSSKKKEPAPKLPEKYKKWLEQEVIYIITPTEREIFLKLKVTANGIFY